MIIFLVIVAVVVLVGGVGVFFGAPFVPTRKIWVDDALKLAEISRNDVVVDLGSGDGAVLAEALKFGAKKAVGYEINPLLVAWSRIRLRKFREKVEIFDVDFFRAKLPRDTTVVYLFQIERVAKKLPVWLAAQRGEIVAKKLKVVSFGFDIPDMKVIRAKNGMKLYEL